jgi:hypothetical protein
MIGLGWGSNDNAQGYKESHSIVRKISYTFVRFSFFLWYIFFHSFLSSGSESEYMMMSLEGLGFWLMLGYMMSLEGL